MRAKLSLAHRGSLEPDHILHGVLSGSFDTRQARLRSRGPFVSAARIFWASLPDLASALLNEKNHKWNAKYYENVSRLSAFVPGTSARPVGMGLPRAAWVKLNRLRTGQHQCCRMSNSIRPCTNGVSLLHRIASVALLNKSQTKSIADKPNVLTACPIHRAPHGARDLTVLDDEIRCWPNNINASI